MDSRPLFALTVSEFKSLITETVISVLDEHYLTKENSEILMNIQEAAALMNLAIPTLYEKTSKRIIPHYKHGKKLLFKKSELLAWIESSKRRTVGEIKQEALKRNSTYR